MQCCMTRAPLLVHTLADIQEPKALPTAPNVVNKAVTCAIARDMN